MPDSRKDSLQSQVSEHLRAEPENATQKAYSVNGHENKVPPSFASAVPQSLSAVTLAKHQPPDWFFAELIPQGAYLIVGRPKVGKSWLLLQLVITAAAAGKFIGFDALGAFAGVYFAAEDDPGRISSRFSKFRVDSCPPGVSLFMRDECDNLAREFAPHFTFPEFLDLWLAENPGIKIVLLDTEETLRSIWEAYRPVEKEDREVTRKHYRETRAFDKIAHRRRVFIGLVNHTAKQTVAKRGGDPHEQVNRTNTALAGCSGSIVITDLPGSDPLEDAEGIKLLAVRGRDLSKDIAIAIQQDAYGLFQSLGPYQAHKQTEAEAELLQALEEMTEAKECDSEGWVTSSELASWTERKDAAVRRCLTRMTKAGKTKWKKLEFEARRNKGYRLIDPASL